MQKDRRTSASRLANNFFASLKSERLQRLPGNIMRGLPRWALWLLGIIFALMLLLFIASFFLDEPLRRYVEKKVNQDLKGYSVRLPSLHFQILTLTLTLKGLTVTQDAHPDPPVATFPVIRAGVHWREILSGKLVAEFRLDRPRLNINLKQLRAEAASKVPLKKRGWQQAVEDIYPLKINVLRISDGELTYIDQDPRRPLKLNRINLEASNIRNIRSADRAYPSPFHMETGIFGEGRGVVDGKADFLAEPHVGMDGSFELKKVPLDYFSPMLARANLSVRKGLLSTSGRIEYAPKTKIAHVKNLEIQGMEVDYIHSEETEAAEKRRAEKAKRAAAKAGEKTQLRLDRMKLTDCTIGMINRKATPAYRVFLADTDLTLTNLSNRFAQGPASAVLTGKFMGSGSTAAKASFRQEKNGPDFDLNLIIENTRLTDMNNLFLAYGKFDVAAGAFFLYSEIHVADRRISGYVKPFFRDMKVYDRRQDKEKQIFRRLYEFMVGGIANLLERRPDEDVATRAEISGSLKDPNVSTWQVILGVIRNAFFKAILPGFEKEVSGS